MKSHLTYIAIIIGLIIALFLFIDKSQRKNAEIDRRESVIAEKGDSIKYWKNSAGQAVASKIAAEVSTKELKEFYKEEIDQIREEMGINTKNLRAFVKTEFAAQGEGTTIVNNQFFQDSSGVRVERNTFMIADGYLTLDAILDSTKVNYKYNYKDELLLAFHTKRKSIFSKEKLYGSGRLKNKNATIVNSTSVLIDSYKDKRFNLSVGIGYDPFLGRATIGIFAGYALIKL